MQFQTDDKEKYKFVEKAAQMAVDGKHTADVAEVVRCKDCKYHFRQQEPCHGETQRYCARLYLQVYEDFYCSYGERREE